MSEFDNIKAQLLEGKPKKKKPSGGLSSGSTLLNLAITGSPDYAFLPSHYYLLVGDSQAGKTFISMTTMAEACLDPKYAKYQLIHDNPERGALMDVKRYFGGLHKRLHPPSAKGSSETIQDFYANLEAVAKTEEPFIYVLDSEDALFPKVKPKKKGKDGEDKGSYGVEKAKLNSTELRMAHNSLKSYGSMLFIIKQTRDNIGFDAMFNPKTRSGGKALTFYACCELWFSVAGRIKPMILGKKRVVGSRLQIHVKKNRIAGRDRTVKVDFFPSVGIDDTGSMVNWLVEEGAWEKGKSGSVVAPEFDFKGYHEKLVQMVESDNREGELRKIVSEKWDEIEEACAVVRKNRYV